MHDPLECRICGDGAAAGRPLIAPCDCAGTSERVHAECLRRWIELRPSAQATPRGDDEGALYRCEVCQQPYRITWSHRFQLNRVCTPRAARSAAEGVAIVTGLAAVLWVSASTFGVGGSRAARSWADTTIVGLMVATTAFVSAQAARRVWGRWRVASSISDLSEAPRAE